MVESDMSFLVDHGLELAGRILTAILVGFLLGYERQRKGKPVGILTAVLVAFGSMIFVYAGVVLTRLSGGTGDDVRIAAMIVSGIGFIGAGSILRSKFQVTGLASAATIWTLGGLGVLIGWGHVITAVLTGTIVFILLRIIPRMEHRLFNGKLCMHLDILVEQDKTDVVRDFLRDNQVSLADSATAVKEDHVVLSVNECGMESKTGILDSLRRLEGVVKVIQHTYSRVKDQGTDFRTP
ncbi:MAG: MgtC/SapB family protein [Fidelibacterota bacterium]